MHKFPYKWYLKNGYPAEKNGLKVFSTFACGGGSSMGYRLAGYEVIGANDIDPQMAKVYQHNHKPKHYFLCPIGDLLTKELPDDLYNLDILDGSPPCSTFSISGSREKAFGKDKKFREGQAKQVLSDLFFDWIALVDKLRPKVAIAENVKGMISGNAKAYTRAVVDKLRAIGYDVQLFCLNAASMGVPQKRERVFFICSRRDLKLPKLKMEFNERAILFGEVMEKDGDGEALSQDSETYKRWLKRIKTDKTFGYITKRLTGKASDFNSKLIHLNSICPTMTSKESDVLYDEPRHLSKIELCQIGSYPLDYQFLDVKPRYLIGMSVPPVMTAQIASEVYLQWFKNAKVNM